MHSCFSEQLFFHNSHLHEQPLELFNKKSCLKKFCNIHRKIPLLESLFNKNADLQGCNFIKKRLQDRRFPVILRTFYEQLF